MSDAPPLDVSKKLGAAEASQRQKVVDDVTKVYEALRVLYEAPPPVCDLREDECKPKWTAAAKELLRIEDAVPKPRDFGLCGYPPPDLLDETMELGAAHEAFLREGLIPKVRALLDARAARTGVLSLQVWLKHSARPKPGVLLMPCLSCVAPQSFHFGAGISFTEGSSSLDAAGQAEVQRLADVLKTHKASDVTVRGHCDPGEADAARLSLSRAVAVQSALANEGIDKARVKVLGSGSELTVASSKTEGGRAQKPQGVGRLDPLPMSPAQRPASVAAHRAWGREREAPALGVEQLAGRERLHPLQPGLQDVANERVGDRDGDRLHIAPERVAAQQHEVARREHDGVIVLPGLAFRAALELNVDALAVAPRVHVGARERQHPAACMPDVRGDDLLEVGHLDGHRRDLVVEREGLEERAVRELTCGQILAQAAAVHERDIGAGACPCG
jgi:outer membrane protein OmpA-like peptidoglycan-associated protein